MTLVSFTILTYFYVWCNVSFVCFSNLQTRLNPHNLVTNVINVFTIQCNVQSSSRPGKTGKDIVSTIVLRGQCNTKA